MSKLNTALLFRSYIWLTETIYSAGYITRQEIDDKWARNTTLNHHNESHIPERTFHNWKNAIQDLFQIVIACDRSRGSAYYIENKDDLKHDDVRAWMLNTFAVNTLVSESRDLNRQILFEKIPSGQHFLAPIIEAMRDKVVLKMTYQSFSKSHSATFTVKPYCVKVYRQRWYMLGKSEVSELRMYALDRIVELQPTGKHYRLPANFDAEAYFAHLVGVSDVKNKPEFVSVRVNKHQVDYLRTLPIHDSQHEEERNEDYSIFRYFVVPNFEFVQELRAQGSALQVLEPTWLADRMRKESKKVTALYEDEQRK